MIAVVCAFLAAQAPSAEALKKKAGPGRAGPISQKLAAPIAVDLALEKPGAEPSKAFLAVVGDWSIAEDGGRKVLTVDGRKWKRGQPAGGLVEKARAIYGARHEEFIDNVKAFAYYPYAVAQGIDGFTNGELKVRFKLLAGDLDQCAGILFNLKPDGDYLALRFNGKEDNLVLWTFYKGKRSFVKKADRDVPLPLGEWHELKLTVKDTRLEGYLDGQLLLEYPMIATVDGKVGVWSKTDSVAEFDGFTVTPALAEPAGAPRD